MIYIQPIQKKHFPRAVTVFFPILVMALLIMSGGGDLMAEENVPEYLDEAGLNALRLWEEGKKEQAIAEATRLYWDYWYSNPSAYYSACDLWFKHEMTRKWLKNPKKCSPPPPPPVSYPWAPYAFPGYVPVPPYTPPYGYVYPQYYPSPYFQAPDVRQRLPHRGEPRHQWKKEEKKNKH